jgi:hypothetical protein
MNFSSSSLAGFCSYSFIAGKITKPNFFIGYIFQFYENFFALTVLGVEFGHFYSG